MALIIIGLIVLVLSFSVDVPSAYKTFLGIPYAVNPEFVYSFNYKMATLMFGLFTLGMGLGVLIITGSLRELEKKLEQKATTQPSPPPPS
jgi:hypothetical protein